MKPGGGRALVLILFAAWFAVAPAVASAQPTATPNSAYVPGLNAVSVTGGGSAAEVAAVIERDSGMAVEALWMLFAGSWRYFLPTTPWIDGGLTLFPQTGSALAALSPRPPMKTITTADNGATVDLSIGERFALDLGPGFIWQVTVDDPQLVRSDPIILIYPPPSRTTWTAIARGETTLRAVGDPPCRQASPPCLEAVAPTILFTVRLVVR